VTPAFRAGSSRSEWFARAHKRARILAQPDFTPFVETRGTARLSKRWLFVPAGILALALLVPVGFGIAHVRRSRRAWRAYRAGSAASPRCTRTTDEAAPFQPKALSTRAEGAPAKHSREMRSISRG